MNYCPLIKAIWKKKIGTKSKNTIVNKYSFILSFHPIIFSFIYSFTHSLIPQPSHFEAILPYSLSWQLVQFLAQKDMQCSGPWSKFQIKEGGFESSSCVLGQHTKNQCPFLSTKYKTLSKN